MRTFVAALAASAMLGAPPGLAAVDAAPERPSDTARYGVQQKSEAGPSHDTMRGRPTYPHRSDGKHHHEVIVVYVPSGSPYAPYYYPASPVYVDADPPANAYRDLSGLYYWCPDPAGYYPYTVDCPIGWRLVAP